jgi:hypothetical protein
MTLDALDSAAVRRLVTTVRCPSCGRRFHVDDVEVISRHPAEWLFDVVCHTCESHGWVLAEIEDPYDGPIDRVEVEEWRRFLRHFHGDMRDLLGQ